MEAVKKAVANLVEYDKLTYYHMKCWLEPVYTGQWLFKISLNKHCYYNYKINMYRKAYPEITVDFRRHLDVLTIGIVFISLNVPTQWSISGI